MIATRVFSNAQEKRVAKVTLGKKQANSGATAFDKGDVVTEDFCIECKTQTTEKVSMSIKKEWITKLKQEAFGIGKSHWAIAFNFGGLGNKENFFIIGEKEFQDLQEFYRKEENDND